MIEGPEFDTGTPPGEPTSPPTDECEARAAAVREALRAVVDPEIRIDVVSLGLIRQIVCEGDDVAIQMILTTPFCPYGPFLMQQVRDVARAAVPGDVRVTLSDDLWSPGMMEGTNLAEWGLL